MAPNITTDGRPRTPWTNRRRAAEDGARSAPPAFFVPMKQSRRVLADMSSIQTEIKELEDKIKALKQEVHAKTQQKEREDAKKTEADNIHDFYNLVADKIFKQCKKKAKEEEKEESSASVKTRPHQGTYTISSKVLYQIIGILTTKSFDKPPWLGAKDLTLKPALDPAFTSTFHDISSIIISGVEENDMGLPGFDFSLGTHKAGIELRYSNTNAANWTGALKYNHLNLQSRTGLPVQWQSIVDAITEYAESSHEAISQVVPDLDTKFKKRFSAPIQEDLYIVWGRDNNTIPANFDYTSYTCKMRASPDKCKFVEMIGTLPDKNRLIKSVTELTGKIKGTIERSQQQLMESRAHYKDDTSARQIVSTLHGEVKTLFGMIQQKVKEYHKSISKINFKLREDVYTQIMKDPGPTITCDLSAADAADAPDFTPGKNKSVSRYSHIVLEESVSSA